MKDYLDLIDKQYCQCKREGVSRLSVRWGIWSRKMNIEIRSKIKLNDDQSTGYKYIFSYWATESQLLELHCKSKILKLGRKRELAKMAETLKAIILSGGNELQKIGRSKTILTNKP
jgi:hypothetical protein